MNLLKLIQFLRDRLKTVIWISCAVLALVVPAFASGAEPTGQERPDLPAWAMIPLRSPISC